jgi:hypothetical protein
LIGADAKEIVFTSGATESNNLSIKGVARFYKGKKNHIITTQTVRAPFFHTTNSKPIRIGPTTNKNEGIAGIVQKWVWANRHGRSEKHHGR